MGSKLLWPPKAPKGPHRPKPFWVWTYLGVGQLTHYVSLGPAKRPRATLVPYSGKGSLKGRRSMTENYLDTLAEGIDVPCDLQMPKEPPEWLDKQKFERGRECFKQYPFSVLMSNFRNLVIGLSVPNLWWVIVVQHLLNVISKIAQYFQWSFSFDPKKRDKEKGLF